MQQTKAEQKMFELLQKILLFKKFLSETVLASMNFFENILGYVRHSSAI